MRTRLVLAVLLGMLLAACGSEAGGTTTTSGEGTTSSSEIETTSTSAPETTTTTFETVTVKVVTLPFITFAPYYIGLEEGYFEHYGIDVELVEFTVQEEILPALASGQVDVSSGLVSAGMFNAIARGSDIKITADKGYVDPDGCINWSVLGRKDLVESGDLESADQLAGMTVNIVPATWLEYYLSVVLAEGDLTLDDIEKVNISSPAVPDALDSAQIDVAVNAEPWVTRLGAAGHVPVLGLPQELTPGESGAVQLYGPTLLGENQEAGIRFMAGYLKAVEQYAEGPTERNLEIISEFSQLPEDLLSSMCWPAINTTGDVAVDGVMAFQDFAVERGYLDEVVEPDQFMDDSFLTGARELVGEAG
jgi:ABC-type nitrate/sulfonate/bicarbonate transport system substrate-binding protein